MEKGTTYIVRPLIEPLNRSVERAPHLVGIPPVVGRPGVGLERRADEGPVLHPGHVAGVRVGPVAVGPLGVRELGEGPVVHQQLAQPVVLLGRAVAPFDGGRARSEQRSRPPTRSASCFRSGAWAAYSSSGSGSVRPGHDLVRRVHGLSTDCSGGTMRRNGRQGSEESQFRGSVGPARRGRRIRRHRPVAGRGSRPPPGPCSRAGAVPPTGTPG